jgi:hypothetical protein
VRPVHARPGRVHSHAGAEGGKSVTEVAVESGLTREPAFLEALAKAMDLPYCRASEVAIPRESLDALPAKAVIQFKVIPWRTEDGALRVITSDPFTPGLIDALRLAGGKRIRLALSPAQEIEAASKRLYGVGADTLERMIQDDRIEVAPEETLDKIDLSALDQGPRSSSS